MATEEKRGTKLRRRLRSPTRAGTEFRPKFCRGGARDSRCSAPIEGDSLAGEDSVGRRLDSVLVVGLIESGIEAVEEGG
jgi:hypothetical protein